MKLDFKELNQREINGIREYIRADICDIGSEHVFHRIKKLLAVSHLFVLLVRVPQGDEYRPRYNPICWSYDVPALTMRYGFDEVFHGSQLYLVDFNPMELFE